MAAEEKAAKEAAAEEEAAEETTSRKRQKKQRVRGRARLSPPAPSPALTLVVAPPHLWLQVQETREGREKDVVLSIHEQAREVPQSRPCWTRDNRSQGLDVRPG